MAAHWWQGNAPLAASPSPPSFILSDVEQSFAAVEPANLPFEPNKQLFRGLIPMHLPEHAAWARVAQQVVRTRQLRMTILGCSTTVGCGSADPSPRCDPARGWPRLFHDAMGASLPQLLPGWTYSTQTRVYAKNAVDPTFFAQCTASFVDPSSDIVLVEFFSNMFGVFKQGNYTGLDATIEAIREAAPTAVVVFVVWLKELSSNTAARCRSLIEVIAKRQGADMVDVPRLMLQASHAGQAKPAKWYARDGQDHHPNGAGHWLLANSAMRYIAARLERAGDAAQPVSLGPSEDHRRNDDPQYMYCANCRETGVVKRQVCYNLASEMPVQMPLQGSWTLQDEGSAKGVKKLGYASSRIGDTLELSLGKLCPGGSASARVGYLLSSRMGQGALQLDCIGCRCVALQGILATVSPFPTVQTDVLLLDSRYFPIPGQLTNETSLSVTAVTTFNVVPDSTLAMCTLQVTHVRSSAPRSANTRNSRVRLDSLSLLTKCPRNASV